MSSIVIDVLFIKTIEKTIKRKLTAEEMELVREGEPLWVQKPNGVWMSYNVPQYNMPYDLMPKDTDVRAIQVDNIKKTKFYNILDEDLRNQMLFEVMSDSSKYPTKDSK